MASQAALFSSELSSIQKQIDGKDAAIEKARLGADKKAVKTAVKELSRERKQLLKEYSAASDEKAGFYEQFSKELEKKTEQYGRIVNEKLKEAMSAASQE